MALEQLTKVEKDPHASTWGAGVEEQGRFRRNIYLRVVGMWQRRCWEAASWPQYHREEEGVKGPPKPVLSRRERHGQRIGPLRQLWVSSLAGDDRVNDAPSPLHTPAEGIRPDL